MLTDDELDAIAARADRATPGPWLHGFGCVIFAYPFPPESPAGVFVAAPRGAIVGGYLPDWQAAPTAEFIASAREDVPALVAALRTARAERDRYLATLAFYAAAGGDAAVYDMDGGVRACDTLEAAGQGDAIRAAAEAIEKDRWG